jgi:hypothetical protein
MTKGIKKGSAALLALGALGLGGSAIAQATSTEPVGGPDKDTVQSGDQTTPDTAAKRSAATLKPAAAAETPGTESSTETPGSPGTESSSETATANDGPGGHADEPGNAQADNQFQGQQ